MQLQDTAKIEKAIATNLSKTAITRNFSSHHDSSRENVGKIYRDLALKNSEDFIEIGDMAREMTSSLIEDINDAIAECDKIEPQEPYYLIIVEQRDLQMKRAIARKRIRRTMRPWPEDNTLVFWKNPKTQDLRFCWCLPHWAEMDLTLANASQFDPEYISHIKAWKKVDLRPFGFIRDSAKGWWPDPQWKDKALKNLSPSTP